jgi:hypothetical protein
MLYIPVLLILINRMAKSLMCRSHPGIHNCAKTCRIKPADPEFNASELLPATATTAAITWLHLIAIMTAVGQCAANFTKQQRTIQSMMSSILFMPNGVFTSAHALTLFGKSTRYPFYFADTGFLRLFNSSESHGTVFPRASTMASGPKVQSSGYHKTSTAKAVNRGERDALVAQELENIAKFWDGI